MSKYKKEIILALLVLVVYLPFFAYERNLAATERQKGMESGQVLPVYGSDSSGFHTLAEHMAAFGVLSQNAAPPFEPDTFRTPGYPAILASWLRIFGNLDFYPIFQILLVIATGITIFKLGARMFTPNTGFWAAVIYILDPNVIYHALVLLSETPFMFLFMLSVYLLFVAQKGWGIPKEAWAGILLGAATLVKPVTTYIPIIFIAAIIVWKLKPLAGFWKRAVLPAAVFGLSFFVVLMPWLERNYLATEKIGISSVGPFNLFQYTVPEFLAFRDNISPDEARATLQSKLPDIAKSDYGSLKYSDELVGASLGALKGSWSKFAVFYTVKTIPLFLSSGLENVFASYNDIVGHEVLALNNANMSSLILHGDFGGFFAAARAHPLLTGEQIFWALVCLFALLSLWPRAKRAQALILFSAILYFAAVTGPVASARFKMPLTPFIFILAVAGFSASLPLISPLFGKKTGGIDLRLKSDTVKAYSLSRNLWQASMDLVWKRRKTSKKERGANSVLLFPHTTKRPLLNASSAKSLPSGYRKASKGK